MRITDLSDDRTFIQTSEPFSAKTDIGTDAVIVCGLNKTAVQRIRSWQDAGRKTYFMASLSWGEYQDYLSGKADGKKHTDEIQTSRDGAYVIHSPSMPYTVPTVSFTDYMYERLLPIIDAGVSVIFFESLCFFAKSGYSESFKREWAQYFGEPWIEPHTSPETQFKASKLKSYLAKRYILTVSAKIRNYAISKYNRTIRIYIAVHSPINCSQWNIVTPMSEIIRCPEIDGFAAQVLPGTTKVPNICNGKRAERIFPTAFLEYGAMQELVRMSGKDMIFFHDPIDDNPTLEWEEYRKNYTKSLAASLFHPYVSKYIISPSPERVLTQKFPRDKKLGAKPIPNDYKTVLMTVTNALRRMENDGNASTVPSIPIGIFISDTAMYQRIYPDDDSYRFAYADSIEEFSGFYGLALPLIMHGLPVCPVYLENTADFPNYLDRYKILILSYEFMKPLSPAYHYIIETWVRRGGILVYVGDDSDPFNEIAEWWKQTSFRSPSEHLFDILGLSSKIRTIRKKTPSLARVPKTGVFDVGHGTVAVLDENPAKCAQDASFSQMYLKLLFSAAEHRGTTLSKSGSILIRRGPYQTIATLGKDSAPIFPINGNFIDLLSDNLEYETFIVTESESYYLLYDLDTKKDSETEIIAASAITSDIRSDEYGFSFTAYSPEDMICVARIFCLYDANLYINGKIADYKRDRKTIVFKFPGGNNQIEIIYR